MGQYIVKLHDRYLIWSTIVDAPVTFGMTLDELRQHTKEEYGQQGLRELPKRLERVELHGVSAMSAQSSEELISFNRAGPDESALTIDEVYTAYCLQQPIRDGWVVPTCEALADT